MAHNLKGAGPQYTDAQNAQARFIVERLRESLPEISGGIRHHAFAAREGLAALERALAAYDRIVSEGM